ncbi:PDZ domain-containing protein [Caminibacter mediatlanticus]|uniref:PDZ domain-containing protein n=1 Tax=Caminibacter mediatlanticus TB-2 TaxID=391592 RepID=A0AAI9F246_9BACT|nr:PDZ domain-containing protein [Caminibacter mediatlanticus]EDM23419.1 hypothetical protein CMTB2_09145 [Caminibacter mediatlanticus TB-2]
MKSFKFITPFIIGISISALFWSIINIFLKHTPVFYIPKIKLYEFYKIDLISLFFNNERKKFTAIKNESMLTLKNVKLKAIYQNGNKSFIIVSINHKTKFLYLNDKLNGYKLIKVNKDSAIFEKNNKKYILSFEKIVIPKLNNNEKTYYVPKVIINLYKNNLRKIWQNIGINKIKEGYKITYIKKGSIFEKIGLKKGDILLEVNGRKLNSDADAWDLYRNLDKFNFFEIKIKRNNQIKVLNYEVN